MAKAIPSETQEQQALFAWAALMQGRYPELALLYANPNGGHRNIVTATRMKAEGVKPGVPDITLPVARCGYHGLYIELKRVKGGRASEVQREWIKHLLDQGYLAVVCEGAEVAQKIILAYLDEEK